VLSTFTAAVIAGTFKTSFLLFFEKQNEHGGMNLQKNQEKTKKYYSKFSCAAVKCQKPTQVMSTS
jgi:hypothetical protein